MSVIVEIDPPTSSESMELATIGPRPSQPCTAEPLGPLVPSSSEQPDKSVTTMRELLDQLNDKGWMNWKDFLNRMGRRRVTIVHLAASAGKVDILERAVELYANKPTVITVGTEEVLIDPWLAIDNHGRCAFHYAAFEGHDNVVSWILNKWKLEHPSEPRHPQISLEDFGGMTPLHDAVRCLNVDVVKLLVENGAAVDVPNKHAGVPAFLPFAIHPWVRGSIEARKNPSERYYDIVKFMLEKSLIPDINFGHPKTGWTMLHHAIFFKSHKAVQYLVDHGAAPNQNCTDAKSRKATQRALWREVSDNALITIGFSALQYAAYKSDLESVRILVNNGGNLIQPYPTSSSTIIDELHCRIDDLVLEDFLTGLFDAQFKSDDEKVTVNYAILAPETEPRLMAVVSALILPREGLHKILKHPLLQLYIIGHWWRFSIVLYSFLALYIIFVILLSWYTIHLVNNNSDPHVWLTASMLAFAIILFLQNLLQFSAEPKWFSMQAKTWLLFVSPTLAIAIAINGLHTSNTSTSWVLYVLSLVLPLSWIQMLHFFAKLEYLPWGHYALLLGIVLKNVLKVLFIGSVVVLGFSLSFFILFHNNDQFENPWKAIVKTMVMMTGEFEYGDLFGTNGTKNSTDRNQIYDDLPLVTGRIVFIVFVILTSIVLMNLMTALALIDVQALVSKGELERSRQRAMFIAHWEQAVRKYGKCCLHVGLSKMIRKCRKRQNWEESDTLEPYNSRPSEIPKGVWRAILAIHEKNKRACPRSQGMESDNTQVTLATIQESQDSMESHIQQFAIKGSKRRRTTTVATRSQRRRAASRSGCGVKLNRN